jgi:hypothetical protein
LDYCRTPSSALKEKEEEGQERKEKVKLSLIKNNYF